MPVICKLHNRLPIESLIDLWLDEEKLLPSQDWGLKIAKAGNAKIGI
jgi:hypothetical protein